MKTTFKKKRSKKTKNVSSQATPESGTAAIVSTSTDIALVVSRVGSSSTSEQETSDRPLRSNTYESAAHMTELFFGFVKDISEATELLSPLKSASALMIRGIGIIRNVHQNTVAWQDLCEDLEQHIVQMKVHREDLERSMVESDDKCLDAFEYYFRIITEVFSEATKPSEPQKVDILHLLRRAGTAQTEKQAITRQRQKVTSAWRLYNTAMNELLDSRVDHIARHFQQLGNTQGLQTQDDYGAIETDFTIAYGERVEVCTPGTRTDILGVIRRWASETRGNQHIFWLNDAAGTGKSTIVATLAMEWRRDHRLAGRFFFSPNSRTTQTTKEFCYAVARDIAMNQPELRSIMQEALKGMRRGQHAWFDIHLQKLVIDPVLKLKTSEYVFLVIDALDNCSQSHERRELLEAFIQLLPSASHVKLFLTSRPLPDIAVILSECPLVHGSDVQLLNSRHPQQHHQDISIYVEKRLINIPMISIEHREMIVARAGGLFLYAATACRMLEKRRKRQDFLKMLSEVGSTHDIEHQMDVLYLSNLKQVRVDEKIDDLMMSVLSMIIIAHQPISINTISRFLNNNVGVDHLVRDLGSVLKDGDPDRPIKVLHPTFREFLLSTEDRANGFVISPTTSSEDMANACLDTLERFLEEDMLGVSQDGRFFPRNSDVADIKQLLGKKTTAAERYASAYWPHHVAASEFSQTLWTRVVIFLSQKFLNWIELMSWRQSINLCIEGLSYLRREVNHRMTASVVTQTRLMLQHAHQFVVHHQSLIDESAFQAYSMALLFTPASSPIFDAYRGRYLEHQPKITTSSVTHWGDYIRMGGHSADINVLIFSPDGSRLISMDRDGLLQLWDTASGALVGEPIKGGTAAYMPLIRNCRFSTDSRRFSFFNWFTGKLYIHYSHSGELVTPPLDAPRSPQGACTFTPTMSHVYIMNDTSIHRCNVEDKQQTELVGTVEEIFDVYDTKLSPDGLMVVGVGQVKGAPSDNARCCLWELKGFKQVRAYTLTRVESTSENTVGIAFSLDSSRFAAWLGGPVLLCDGRSGSIITETRTNRYATIAAPVVFCPKGLYWAHTNDALTSSQVIVRTLQTDRIVTTLRDQASGVILISFSSDGTRFASISQDQKVRVWAVESWEPLDTIFPGYTGDITCYALSPDWRMFVSASKRRQIHLYNLNEGAVGDENADPVDYFRRPVQEIFGASYVSSLISIRTQSEAGAEFWDTATGVSVGRFAHGEYVVGVAFSPDGLAIAYLIMGGDVFILDAGTLEQVAHLRVMYTARETYGGIFFSPDSKLLAVYYFGDLRVWELQTCTRKMSYRSPSGTREQYTAKLFAFSSDSTKVIGVDGGATIYVWDLVSKTNVNALISTSSYKYSNTDLPSSAFCPTDNALVALVVEDKILLWRIDESRLHLASEIPIPERSNGNLSFSSDGRYLAYGSLCWDITSSASPFTGIHPPASFNTTGMHAHSFLSYKDGWIWSGFPQGAVVPIPNEHRGFNLRHHWYTFGDCVILMSNLGEPIVIDCSSLLARSRQD